MSAVVVLDYDIGVVNFIFNYTLPRFDDPVGKMKEATLKQNAMVGSSAQGYVFRQLSNNMST